jgi:hypothetical protein
MSVEAGLCHQHPDSMIHFQLETRSALFFLEAGGTPLLDYRPTRI